MTTAERVAQACADAMYRQDLASQALGIVLDPVQPGRAVARMRVTGAMVNGHGIVHGGYVFLLADTAFAFACNSYDVRTVAAGADIQFIAPARLGDLLIAEAVERHRSGRNGIYDVTVRRLPAAAVPDGEHPAVVGSDGERQVGAGPDGERPVGAGLDDEHPAAEVIAEFRGRSRTIGGSLLD